ncbi:MAG TPA: hypothetical protein VF438_02215 [Candidatus Paceibacterota bacterium]
MVYILWHEIISLPSAHPNIFDWMILTASLAAVWTSVRIAQKQQVPNLSLIESSELTGIPYFRVVSNNTQLVFRIRSYGYVDFDGNIFNVPVKQDQYATFIPTDWGPKLIFEPQPLVKNVFCFYIDEIHTNKKHLFYPNGKWSSRFKYNWPF